MLPAIASWLAAAIVSLGAGNGVHLPDGTQFAPADGNFSIQMPKGFTEPVASDMPIQSAVGPLNMKLYTSLLDAQTVMLISYTDYPDPASKTDGKVLIKGARDGAMKSLKGTVLNEKETATNGIAGRSVLFSGLSSGHRTYGRVDYYYDQPRLYTLLLLTPKQSIVSSAPIGNAFASFAITPGSTATH
ncbi:MAG TPA: hypothetical protein VHI13_14750 [Candidatus Kapabacteria bacterium]|nr:hypothetical protein [Candidatus Kapabacteria bacterium]